jgi:hypothetical protein
MVPLIQKSITMKMTSICFFLLSSIALAGTPALEGIVKDSKGHPIKGAEVRIEARTGVFSKTLKTDAKGHYFVDKLALGTNYKVTLVINGTVKASILNATAHAGKKPTELNFDLSKTKGPSKTHMVYMPQETGTHIGSGRWVTVDDNGNVVDDNPNVKHLSPEAMKQMQNSGTGRKGN